MTINYAFPGYFSHPIGGYNVHFEYASLLAARGHHVTLLFPRSLDPGASRFKAFVWRLRLRLRQRPLIGTFRLHPKVRVALTSSLAPDALPSADVLVATAWQTAEALQAAPERCGRKHFIVYDYEHWLASAQPERGRIEATFRMGYRMLAGSTAVAQMIRQSGAEAEGVAPCGIDPSVFALDQPIEDREPFVLMFGARGEPTKNLQGALDAVAILQARYGGRLRVLAYGAPDLELPPSIEYHVRPTNAELRGLYNRTTVFLCASFGEGWGLPSVEAMTCGAALVTTDNGGSRDFAHDQRTALVVETTDANALADAVGSLLENDGLRKDIARAGHAWVQRYRWDEAAGMVERFLLN